MDLRHLEIFLAVFETCSFSKAAKILSLTQPTISSHIKTLENDLETRLFDRLGREIAPTKAGRLLYRYAKEIERLKMEATEAVGQSSGRLKGRLDVGGSTIPGEYLLPPVIGRFRSLHPDVTITLRIGDSEGVARMVAEGVAEVGVVGARPKESRIESTTLSSDELILVAPPSYGADRISCGELKKVPLVFREEGSGSRTALQKALGRMGIDADDLHIVAEMGSTEAVKQAVKSGLGLSVVSRLAVREELGNGSLKEIDMEGLPVSRSLYIITNRLRAKSLVCRTFLRFLPENL